MTVLACVLRSGGDYGPEHVERLARQAGRHHPEAPFVCLSDMEVPGIRCLPLLFDWPGWWAKMELFRPDLLLGDMLYLDLDSSIVGPLDDMLGFGRLAIMRDVYRPGGLQSSVMYLPEAERAAVWRAWIAAPDRWMREFRRGGDQAFLERPWRGHARRWQDDLPGQVVSYKVHVRKAHRRDREFGDGTVPEGARLVAFHGRPRPWEVGW